MALTAIVYFAILQCFTPEAGAAAPLGTAHQFYGTVTGSGGLVGAGLTVTAMINGQQAASTTTDAHGQWGYSPLFVVTAPSSSSIEFYVNGVLAGTAAGCISTNRLDLVYNAPVNPSSNSNTNTTVATQGSGGTITFYIGKQPSGSSTGATAPAVTPAPLAIPPVTSIAVTELLVSPQTAYAGKDVTVTVSLVNRGNIEFTGGVVLKINDVVDQQKDITLAVGESRTLGFPVSKREPGNYRASIDDYSTSFVITSAHPAMVPPPQFTAETPGQQTGDGVDSNPVPPQKTGQLIPDNPWLAIIVLAVGLIIAVYLITVIVRQRQRY